MCSQYNFRRSDWNIQLFRFRSRRVQTTEYAFDALIYQDYDSAMRLRSSPLDYILSQLDLILANWDMVINASLEFLASFVRIMKRPWCWEQVHSDTKSAPRSARRTPRNRSQHHSQPSCRSTALGRVSRNSSRADTEPRIPRKHTLRSLLDRGT
jgi:hypothetical protein